MCNNRIFQLANMKNKLLISAISSKGEKFLELNSYEITCHKRLPFINHLLTKHVLRHKGENEETESTSYLSSDFNHSCKSLIC